MNKYSEIGGQGYGDKHAWIRGATFVADRAEDKGTIYSCICGANFVHRYDLIPDIFENIKQAGVREDCKP